MREARRHDSETSNAEQVAGLDASFTIFDSLINFRVGRRRGFGASQLLRSVS